MQTLLVLLCASAPKLTLSFDSTEHNFLRTWFDLGRGVWLVNGEAHGRLSDSKISNDYILYIAFRTWLDSVGASPSGHIAGLLIGKLVIQVMTTRYITLWNLIWFSGRRLQLVNGDGHGKPSDKITSNDDTLHDFLELDLISGKASAFSNWRLTWRAFWWFN